MVDSPASLDTQNPDPFVVPKIDPPPFSRITAPVRKPLTRAVILGGLASVAMIVQMGGVATLVNDFVIENHTVSEEYLPLAVVIIASLARFLLQWGCDNYGDAAAVEAVSDLRKEVLQRIFDSGPLGLTERSSGEIASALANGIDAIGPFVARYVPRMAAMLITPLIILGVVLKLDRISFFVLLVTGPLVPLFMALVGYAAQSVLDKQWSELLRLSGSFLDFLRGLTTLRLFGRSQDSARRIDYLTDRHRIETLKVMRIAFLTSAVLEFFSSLSIAMVAVFFGARLLNGPIDFFIAFYVLLLAPEYFLPLRIFSASYHARQNAQSAFNILAELLSLPPFFAVARKQGDYVPAQDSDRISPRTDDGLTHPAKLETLIFKNVTLEYENGTLVFNDLNVAFRADGLNVVSGPSGSGKSTLYRAVLGMLPLKAGHIWGVLQDGKEVSRNQIKLGWVPQKPYFLAGTIADNLRLVQENATDSELEKACRLAHAWEFIEKLHGGLNFELSEGGTPLSGGQIRRLAIARALLANPQLLLLDEPTADLDAQSAEVVTKALNEIARTRLTIAISHRLELSVHASAVYELKNRNLVEIDRKTTRTGGAES